MVSASAPEWSDKLLRYEVDLGEEIGNRVLFSGIRKWYTPEELIGKNIPVVINLAPKKMGDPSAGSGQGEESQGMCIMVDTKERPFLIFLPDGLELGSVIR
ncbi:MAG: Methionyl-tRNA synthetase [Candidatus Collierbacteria bacterium GW2011_GWD2_45_10]|uniref:Methionyl-tRNA synthetase n=1 Tax=Candidatus Collierbacteria bacterium GW2011_GWB2_44_22 TaxID=1618387 RepID=A0A0G1HWF6_9BACT|nr:MAG: Methionyl-tRNA synthetase [Candidatus Collierbacteria bacterium GW2011_GWA2_44_13]KKT51446.1 MAG: Methionyl-tRNA synthetase [Candidatus Collierbacteria bacterium GW2011_GWB2_44_22]KKT88649.1 MAG: Methionyl-tRNA synthetase [Candidatus Collierbacteria bacterium GW2011_GWD2_45_10]